MIERLCDLLDKYGIPAVTIIGCSMIAAATVKSIAKTTATDTKRGACGCVCADVAQP